jgi:hypothetical protein
MLEISYSYFLVLFVVQQLLGLYNHCFLLCLLFENSLLIQCIMQQSKLAYIFSFSPTTARTLTDWFVPGTSYNGLQENS